MASVIVHVVSWPAFAAALLVFGFAPGAVLRLVVLIFRRDDPRRRELLGELYAVPRIERPFWVIEQLEVALFEGLRSRLARRVPADLAGAGELAVCYDAIIREKDDIMHELAVFRGSLCTLLEHHAALWEGMALAAEKAALAELPGELQSGDAGPGPLA
jgi:hypothetical protein